MGQSNLALGRDPPLAAHAGAWQNVSGLGGVSTWLRGAPCPAGYRENSLNSLKTIDSIYSIPRQKNFEKMDLTPKAGLRYKGASLPRQHINLFIFDMLQAY